VPGLIQGLHNLQTALAERLTNRVEENENEIHMISQPHDGLLNIKGILQKAEHIRALQAK
jgi:hypothetical protein